MLQTTLVILGLVSLGTVMFMSPWITIMFARYRDWRVSLVNRIIVTGATFTTIFSWLSGTAIMIAYTASIPVGTTIVNQGVGITFLVIGTLLTGIYAMSEMYDTVIESPIPSTGTVTHLKKVG